MTALHCPGAVRPPDLRRASRAAEHAEVPSVRIASGSKTLLPGYQPALTVPVGPVRDRVALLLGVGMSRTQVAEAAEVDTTTITRLLRADAHRVHADTAVALPDSPGAPPARRGSAGDVRRSRLNGRRLALRPWIRRPGRWSRSRNSQSDAFTAPPCASEGPSAARSAAPRGVERQTPARPGRLAGGRIASPDRRRPPGRAVRWLL